MYFLSLPLSIFSSVTLHGSWSSVCGGVEGGYKTYFYKNINNININTYIWININTDIINIYEY